MKKLLALAIACVLVFALVSCAAPEAPEAPFLELTEEQYMNIKVKSEGVMTYAQYAATPDDSDAEVVIEAYVQDTQSWWDNKITVYAADLDGAYFIYEMACSEADAAKLTPGTKIKVTGTKGAWAGEVEVMNATFEFVGADDDTYVAPALDVSPLVGKDCLINYQNQLVAFKGVTIKTIEYKNGEPGDDIYVTVTKGEVEYSFCVEKYLTDPETDLYKSFVNEDVKVGDVVDVEGFLYWYEGVNTHITNVTVAD